MKQPVKLGYMIRDVNDLCFECCNAYADKCSWISNRKLNIGTITKPIKTKDGLDTYKIYACPRYQSKGEDGEPIPEMTEEEYVEYISVSINTLVEDLRLKSSEIEKLTSKNEKLSASIMNFLRSVNKRNSANKATQDAVTRLTNTISEEVGRKACDKNDNKI